MEGFFLINRKLLDSPLWLSEPFSWGHAWLDLIGLANYQDNYIRIAGESIPILRGQCGWSTVKLSLRWRWSRNKVLRFLAQLEIEHRIVRDSNHRTTIITICNYEQYQSGSSPYETSIGLPDGTTESTTDGALSIKGNKENKKKNPPTPQGAAAQVALIDAQVPPTPKPAKKQISRFEEFWAAYPKRRDKHRAVVAYAKAIAAAEQETIINGAAQYAAEREADTRPESDRFTKAPATWLTGKCWQDYEDLPPAEDTSGLSMDEIMQRKLASVGLV